MERRETTSSRRSKRPAWASSTGDAELFRRTGKFSSESKLLSGYHPCSRATSATLVNSHLQSQPQKATIFYAITFNQAKKLTGGSSVLVYWAGGPPASKHQMYLTKPPGSEHFSLIEPRSLADCLSNCPTDHHLNQNQVGFLSHGRHSLF